MEPRPPVDARDGPFVLTGSAVPAEDVSRHTGAGRFSWIRTRPMTLFALGHSSVVSLAKLVAGDGTSVNAAELSVAELSEITCVGAWPALLGAGFEDARRSIRGYLDSVARTDIRRVDGVARDPQKVWRALRSLARHVSTEAAITTIASDAGASDGPVDADSASS